MPQIFTRTAAIGSSRYSGIDHLEADDVFLRVPIERRQQVGDAHLVLRGGDLFLAAHRQFVNQRLTRRQLVETGFVIAYSPEGVGADRVLASTFPQLDPPSAVGAWR